MTTTPDTQAMRRLGLLDAPPEESFDRITRLAARLLDCNAVFITLLDDDRDFFLSHAGTAWPGVREVTGDTLCRHSLQREGPLIIPDTSADPEFRDVESVVKFGIGAYVGIPLRLSNGSVIGEFCAAHASPREWTDMDVATLQDLAASVMTEIELRQARSSADAERTKTGELFDGLDAIVWELDAATSMFTNVNRYAEELLGYPLSRWLEEPGFWENVLVHPDDRAITAAFCAEATAARCDHDFEYRAVAADGRVFWLHDRVRVVTASDGSVLLRGVMVDISERKRSADAVRSSEEKFRQIAEHVQDVLWMFTADFSEAVYVSPEYERISGRSLQSLYDNPRSFLEAVHPDDVEALGTVMQSMTAAGTDGVEYRITHADGSIRWLLTRGFAVRDEDGTVSRLVGTTKDITERKALQSEAQMLAAALHSLGEGVVIASMNGQIIYANETHARLFGYDLGSQPLPNIHEFSPDADARADMNSALAHVAEDGTWTGRLRRVSRRGELLRIQVNIGRVDRKTLDPVLFIIARDITEELRREQHLRRAERMASVGTLIGGVAHELNNPLHSITNFANLLLETPRSQEEAEDLEIIRREAMRAAKIVSDLRLLARESQEARRLNPVDINDVVRHVLKTREYALATHNITLQTDLASTMPMVSADRSELEQVVVNLVVNAEQAMEQITRPRVLTVRTRALRQGIALYITDVGEGIPADRLDRIFDPFYTTKSPGEGTGLGLSLIYSIISEIGGHITVESKQGVGSEFRVTIPRGTGASHPLPAVTTAPGFVKPLHLLVVEDEPAIRRALSRFLTRRGHTVDLAVEGGEALALIDKASELGTMYDVILSDLRMPGLGGDQLLDALREKGTGIDRRVLFLTGDAASGDAARILAASNAPVIYKPIELADVANRIERHAFELRTTKS